METQSDEEILAAYRSGTDEAFDVLVQRYARDLYRFLYRFTGRHQTAEDIVQETFMQVHLAAAEFDVSLRFKPWLFTIAANKARDHLRRRARRQEASLDAGVSTDAEITFTDLLADKAQSVESTAEAAELAAAVKHEVDALPDHLRLVLSLSYYEGFPHKEIGRMLGIPVGTVKSRLHAAVWAFAERWQRRTAGVRVAQVANPRGSP